MATNKLPHFIDIDHEGRDIRIERPAGTCICGCGQPTNDDSRFRQGHDQRYRGILLHAYRLNYSVSIVDGGLLVTCDPQQQAVNDGVDMGKIKWVAGTIKQLNKKTAEEKPKIEKPALTTPDLMDALEQSVTAAKAARTRLTKTEPAGPAPAITTGSVHQIKVGRWMKDATAISVDYATAVVSLQYETAKGPQITTRTTAELCPEA